MNRRDGLAIQSWLTWGVAATLPFLVGRNPYLLAVTLAMIGTVSAMCHGPGSHSVGWRLIARTMVVIAAFAILFNVLTARTGNQVIVDVPDSFWILSGPITWNAVVYGVLAAVAVFGMVLVWATVGSVINWASLTRIMPERLTGIAVAGSTAINLVPQTVHAISEIREATAARGFTPTGARGAATLITPVINGGLDRSMRMAEVLEARGFGSRTGRQTAIPATVMLAWNLLLAGGFAAVYGFVAGITWASWGGLAAFAIGVIVIRRNRDVHAMKRTHYREEKLEGRDWLVILVSMASMLGIVIANAIRPDAFRYEPYPDIVAPVAVLWPLLPVLLLIVPALVAPNEIEPND